VLFTLPLPPSLTSTMRYERFFPKIRSYYDYYFLNQRARLNSKALYSAYHIERVKILKTNHWLNTGQVSRG